MQNVRYNISPCTSDEVQAFISRINEAEYERRNIVLADSRSHYDRYSYLRDDSKIAVVYDTTAHVISITAPQNYADDLLSVFAPTDKSVKRSTVPAQGTKVNAPQSGGNFSAMPTDAPERGTLGATTRCRVFEKPKEPIRTAPTLIATAKGAEMYSDEICPPQRAFKRVRTDVGTEPGLNNRRVERVFEYSDEIAPPQIVRRNNDNRTNTANAQRPNIQPPQQRQNAAPYQARPDIASGDDMKYRGASQPGKYSSSTPTDASPRTARQTGGVHRATISFGDEDYTSPRIVRQTPGLRSGTGLYADISSAGAPTSDNAPTETPRRGRGRPPKNAATVSSDSYGAAAPVEDKRLKRRIPTAYDLLPQQARDDLSGGLKNFEQTQLTMTDYSGLLMQPYRGLEAFVLDLQRAEGIRVKMIGQAFDKDDNGNYVLKSGYMQKIGSIVYGEVMVALYTEYFSRRNYFAHTDNSESGSVPRSIPDRAIAKSMFDNLLNVIEYNARKLKEIGFGTTRGISNK